MLNNITKTSCVIINILISEISKYLNTKNIINSNIKNTTKYTLSNLLLFICFLLFYPIIKPIKADTKFTPIL